MSLTPEQLHLPYRQTALRARLDRAGVVFQFGVWQAEPHGDPETVHAAALHALFAHTLQEWHDAQAARAGAFVRERLVAAKNENAREKIRRAVGQNPFPPLTFHPETARSVPLDIRFLQSTDSLRPHRDYAQTVRPHSRAAAQSEFDPQNWFVRLYRDFNEPPYGLGDLSDTGRRALWTDFCTQTGLLPDRGVSVRDWVRHNGFDSKGRAQSARHPLSSYFDDSLEWWGIWCLTVHNPRRGKVAAVAASVTD